MTVDHQVSQAWLLPCRAHASARWRQFGTDSGASGDRHEEHVHDPARVSRPEGRAVDRMSRASWPSSTSNAAQTRLLDSLVCASWRAQDRDRLFEGEWSTTAASWTVQDVAQAFSTTRCGSMGASAALGWSDVQNSVMCHSECVVWLSWVLCACSKFLGVQHIF